MNQYNNAQMRKWVSEFFDDEENFDFFCEDQFPDVLEQFADGDSLNKKARALTKYCEENNQYDVLIEKLRAEDSDRFEKFPPPTPLDNVEAVKPASIADTPEEMPTPDKTEPAVLPTSSAGDEPPENPKGTLDVFISYSRRDEAFIKQLYQRLTSNGISAWYDRVEIKPGEQWRESIVNGITNSKVFMLVLSPDSTKSDPVRREISLAQDANKTFVPILWRQTDFPNTIKYQLAGIQYIDFQETASDENFAKAVNAASRLLGQESIEEVMPNAPVLAPEIVPQPKSATLLSGAKRKQILAVQVTRRGVANSLITPMRLADDSKEQYSEELGWLFTAADHLLRIRRGDEAPNAPIPVPVPQSAAGSHANTMQGSMDDFSLKLTESQVTSIIKQLNIYIRNLNIELRKLAEVGGENNAFTTNDLTNYYCTVPPENLETAFWLESDRMLSLAFTDKSLEVQRSVVIEEFKQRYLNQPYGDVWLLLRPLAYKVHPYKWATIGKEIAHIEQAVMPECFSK